MTEHAFVIADLKPSGVNPGPLTPDRVFTICELIVYRAREHVLAREATQSCTMIADAINEVAAAWRAHIAGAS